MRLSDYYILDGYEPVPTDDVLKWGMFFASSDRRVAETHLPDSVRVSTVFLGLNHQWGDGPPLLFETMVFGGALDLEQERYSTWAEAERGHQAMVLRAAQLLEKSS